MGSVNSAGVYVYDTSDNNIGPTLFNLQATALTTLFGANVTIKKVANITARGTYYTAFGTGTVANPCVVLRADAPAGLQLEFNDGSGWKPWVTWKPPVTTIFTSSGTWNRPEGMKFAIVEVQGDGGGGGGVSASAASQCGVAQSGSGGAYARSILTATDTGSSQTVTVGSGGAGGAAGNNNGSAGTGSSFGSLVSASGGAGGTGTAGTASTTSAIAGGVATVTATGQVVVPGEGCGFRVRFPSGPGNASARGGRAALGAGADEAGIISANSSASGKSATGNGYGGGGSGAVSSGGGSAQPGGDGAPGIVIVTEYF